jgi:hypothetical protein
MASRKVGLVAGSIARQFHDLVSTHHHIALTPEVINETRSSAVLGLDSGAEDPHHFTVVLDLDLGLWQ